MTSRLVTLPSGLVAAVCETHWWMSAPYGSLSSPEDAALRVCPVCDVSAQEQRARTRYLAWRNEAAAAAYKGAA
jgi:hypothetical protein